MESNLLEPTVADVLRGVIEEAEDDLLVVDPDVTTIESLVEVLDVEGGPAVRMLADERRLKDVMDDFLVASRAADLVEAGRLEMRTHEGADNTLVLTPDSVVAVVDANDRVAGLVGDDEAFVESARETYDGAWAAAGEFGLRTPALSEVRSTLESDIGPETAADFDAVLDSLETARGDGDGLDEVTVSLLVAARNEELLYDISKWGEDVGIASKATFSRTKSRLEEAGLIDTEKVPIDVGRPRLRLMLADERLSDAGVDDLVTTVQSVVASDANQAA